MAKHFIKDFPITEENQRNSEGAFCNMPDGRIAFAYSSFRDSRLDDASSDIAVSFSDDNGESFSEGRVAIKCEDVGGTNLMSVSLLEGDDGEIMVFYLKKIGNKTCQLFMSRTKDFVDFSDEVQCITEDGYFVVNNDRVVRLSSGRVVIPSAMLPVNEDGTYGTQIAKVFASDDNCKTFYLLSKLEMPFKIFTCGMMEPGVLEYEKGKVVLFSRNTSFRQLIAYSEDDCKSWTTPEPSRFESPCSPLSAKQLKDGKVIVVYNPVCEYYGRQVKFGEFWMGGRSPLLMSICRSNINDEYKKIMLEDDERAGFCYTAIHELDDKILLGYCAGNENDGGILKRLRIISIDKEDIE